MLETFGEPQAAQAPSSVSAAHAGPAKANYGRVLQVQVAASVPPSVLSISPPLRFSENVPFPPLRLNRPSVSFRESLLPFSPSQ